MAVTRVTQTPEASELFRLADDLAAKELAPRAAKMEERGEFPRGVFRTLGRSGLLGLPYPESYGGATQPYETYLQVVEILAGGWLAVGLGVSVHTLSCFPLASFGTDDQRDRWLPDMVGGELLGAYSLSEPGSGSDAAALSSTARLDGDEYVIDGTKAWVTHGGVADFYSVMVRTSDDGARGVSCLLVPADTPGLSPQPPEKKMGMRSSPTAQLVFAGARVPADRLLGEQGQGFRIALAALDGGRLGISACSVGLAQAAFDAALGYARDREQFGHPILDFQGVAFLLADMATSIEAGRSLYLAVARERDAGSTTYGPRAAMSKLFCSDAAMRVTTDAVQVFGGYGYVTEYPAERYMREAKVLQIVEGTNQIQRVVISRALARG